MKKKIIITNKSKIFFLILCFSLFILSACNSAKEETELSQLQTDMASYRAILDKDYVNEEALANYTLSYIQYNYIANSEEAENIDLTQEYKNLATYAYGYITNTNPKEAKINEPIQEYENNLIETGSFHEPALPIAEETSVISCQLSEAEYAKFYESVNDTDASTESDPNDYKYDIDNMVNVDLGYEEWFPYNTAPAEVWIESITVTGNSITIGIAIDWHQWLQNLVYFEWVNKHLEKGDSPEKLTWDYYYSLEWLEEDYPEFFAPPPTAIPKPTQAPVVPTIPETVPEETEPVEEEIDYAEFQIGVNGNTTCFQPLTGNVMPINGRVPVSLFTILQDTPVGPQGSMELLDENGDMIAALVTDDFSHTAYKYAYLTSLEISDSYTLFFVAGSNTEVFDNLPGYSTGDVETQNGMETYDRYENYPEQ